MSESGWVWFIAVLILILYRKWNNLNFRKEKQKTKKVKKILN